MRARLRRDRALELVEVPAPVEPLVQRHRHRHRPAATAIAIVGGHSGSGTIISSPGSKSAWSAAQIACVPPLVGTISSGLPIGMPFFVRIFSASSSRSRGTPVVGR